LGGGSKLPKKTSKLITLSSSATARTEAKKREKWSERVRRGKTELLSRGNALVSDFSYYRRCRSRRDINGREIKKSY